MFFDIPAMKKNQAIARLRFLQFLRNLYWYLVICLNPIKNSPVMRKLKFKLDFRFTSKILGIHFQLSNEKGAELKPYEKPSDYDEQKDPNNELGEDDDTGWFDDDPDGDNDHDGLNWPPINYN
jgi:hypothetical protein